MQIMQYMFWSHQDKQPHKMLESLKVMTYPGLLLHGQQLIILVPVGSICSWRCSGRISSRRGSSFLEEGLLLLTCR